MECNLPHGSYPHAHEHSLSHSHSEWPATHALRPAACVVVVAVAVMCCINLPQVNISISLEALFLGKLSLSFYRRKEEYKHMGSYQQHGEHEAEEGDWVHRERE